MQNSAGFVDFFPSTRARAPGKIFSPARASILVRARISARLVEYSPHAGARAWSMRQGQGLDEAGAFAPPCPYTVDPCVARGWLAGI